MCSFVCFGSHQRITKTDLNCIDNCSWTAWYTVSSFEPQILKYSLHMTNTIGVRTYTFKKILICLFTKIAHF